MTQQTIKSPCRYDYGTGRITRENCVVLDVETTGLDPTQHRIVVGHNVSFDLSFIDAELEHYGFPQLQDYTPLDTKAYAQRISTLDLPIGEDGRKHYRLCDVAKALNVPQPRAHRAMDDVETTFKVYQELRAAEALEQGFWG